MLLPKIGGKIQNSAKAHVSYANLDGMWYHIFAAIACVRMQLQVYILHNNIFPRRNVWVTGKSWVVVLSKRGKPVLHGKLCGRFLVQYFVSNEQRGWKRYLSSSSVHPACAGRLLVCMSHERSQKRKVANSATNFQDQCRIYGLALFQRITEEADTAAYTQCTRLQPHWLGWELNNI